MLRSFRKLFLLSFLIITSGLGVRGQAQLIDKQAPVDDGITIPYEKYRLPNGLTVIISEDHSDPVATVMITYKVGSDRENIGRSGFAHFFEHMMFQGSKHLANHQHFKVIGEAGGDMNGNTTEDRTQYYNNIPSNQVEKAIWLESDRMGYLLDSLTEKKFENQRATVKNEKFQNQVNRPYGLVGELLGQTLYPYKHPYSWPVIGYVDDLDRATIEDVKNFFVRWYGPNNAVLTISGDVDAKQTLSWVEKYFGNIKRGPEVAKLKVPPVSLASDKYCSYRDKIYLPLSERVYPTVPNYHKDEAPLICLGEMMGDGNNSIFYKKFVKTEKAAAAYVVNRSNELSGQFTIGIYYFPSDETMEDYAAYDKMFKDIEELTKSTLDEFASTGITDESLQRIKAKNEAAILGGIESAYDKAAVLTEWEIKIGRPYNEKDELERFNKVSKEDIIRVFNKYIRGSGAAVVNVYPQVSNKDTVKSINPNAGKETKDDPEYKNLTFTPMPDYPANIQLPVAQAPKIVKIPEYYTKTFDNGLKIIGTKTTKIPVVEVTLNIDGGDLVLSPEELKRNGIAELTAALLNESTQKHSTEELSAELDKIGADISFNSTKTGTTISLFCLKKNLDAALALLNEKLMMPGFNEKDFKRVKKGYKGELGQQKSNPDYISSAAYESILYGHTIWGENPLKKNVDKLELADVKTYYDKFYSPSHCKLVIVGDVGQEEIIPKLDFLKNWQAKEYKIFSEAVPEKTEPQVYIVDKIGAPVSIISMGHSSLLYNATGDYYKNRIANFMLGGNFNSRLNLNLREDKGYTYGITSSFYGDRYIGYLKIKSAVKRQKTGNSLVEIIKETDNYIKNGLSQEDIDFTKNSLLNSEAMRYETNDAKATFLDRIIDYNLDKDFTLKQSQILKDLTREDFNNQIKKAYDPSKMFIVIVGDKFAIKKQMELINFNTKDFNDKLNIKKFKEIEVD